MKKILLSLMSAGLVSPAMAGILSDYTHFETRYIPGVSEASAITYNWDTGTFYTIGDEGAFMAEIDSMGNILSTMQFAQGGRFDRAIDDPEGLAYLGGGKVMIADERDNKGRVVSYDTTKVPTLAELELTSYAFGPNVVSNSELEGVAYDKTTNSVWGVKELGPIKVYNMTGIPELTGSATTPVVTEPLAGRPLNRITLEFNITSFSDIYIMATSAAYAGSDSILLLARDQKLILEIGRDGTIRDSLDISSFGRGTIEGLTMDDAGNIYLVSEENPLGPTPESRMSGLHVISTASVPEPSTYALIGVGAVGVWMLSRRRRNAI